MPSGDAGELERSLGFLPDVSACILAHAVSGALNVLLHLRVSPAHILRPTPAEDVALAERASAFVVAVPSHDAGALGMLLDGDEHEEGAVDLVAGRQEPRLWRKVFPEHVRKPRLVEELAVGLAQGGDRLAVVIGAYDEVAASCSHRRDVAREFDATAR